VSQRQKGGNEEKQEKGGAHKRMLRLIKGEESEDAGLRRVTMRRIRLFDKQR
jgi:hypothetical protein